MNTQLILEQYIENIIQIMTPYGSGTGFIIDDLIVTNSHVVAGLKEVVISSKRLNALLQRLFMMMPILIWPLLVLDLINQKIRLLYLQKRFKMEIVLSP